MKATPLLSLLVIAGLAAASGPALAQVPGPTALGGQKVLTLISRDPPGVRCNNNIQIAAELSNIYKIPVVVVPVSQAGAGAKAPSVYYGGQLLAQDGGDFNGMVSYQMIADVLEIEGAPRQEQQGRLMEVKKDFETLKTSIKAAEN
ncbi:MAG: hypothetical protein HY778_15205 [Betaproteobacteria bacterium]|nr:hypothetical protein [Betaproteobacteria bacterium]